jgi:hypothetical protein
VSQVRELRQGDVIRDLKVVHVLGADGVAQELPAPDGVAVISQTCDVLRAPYIQVGQIVEMSELDARNAAKGKRPRYAPIPAIGDRYFVDLAVLGSVDREIIENADLVRGVVDAESANRLRISVSRRFGRFPFPDVLDKWLGPLKDKATSKSGKPESPEGRALDRIRQIRVRCHDDWDSPPYRLTISFILGPDELPTVPDEPLAPGNTIDTIKSIASASEMANLLVSEPLGASRSLLWQTLAEHWVSDCTKAYKGEIVVDVDCEVVGVDEYTLAAYEDSEQLDLDHLTRSQNLPS